MRWLRIKVASFASSWSCWIVPPRMRGGSRICGIRGRHKLPQVLDSDSRLLLPSSVLPAQLSELLALVQIYRSRRWLAGLALAPNRLVAGASGTTVGLDQLCDQSDRRHLVQRSLEFCCAGPTSHWCAEIVERNLIRISCNLVWRRERRRIRQTLHPGLVR